MDKLSRLMSDLKSAGDPYFLFWSGLRNLYASFNMTQAQFADRLGIAQSYLSRILSGAKIPKRSTVAEICDALNMSFEDVAALADSDNSQGATQSKRTSFTVSKEAILKSLSASLQDDRKADMIAKQSRDVLESRFGFQPDQSGGFLPFVSTDGDRWIKTGKSPLIFNQDWALSIGASGNLAVYRATDDCMEPSINQGDFVVIDISSDRLVNGKIYLIHIQGGFLSLARYKDSSGNSLLSVNKLDKAEDSISPGVLEDSRGNKFFDFGDKDMLTVVGRAVMVVRAVL